MKSPYVSVKRIILENATRNEKAIKKGMKKTPNRCGCCEIREGSKHK